ncbi:nucleoside ABC transporter ATP-binding protein [Aminobacter aminovorans]|uniref:Galactose/methyl galactoside import ATP-binding protein MglA n=1 Tax=Aminobacter aminovorans TaxID=83263 RepID=A0A380WIT4_AMIAI|nr:ABC transporter ATP-binding protein [Aminobacter aminovorans]TCS26689.1 nucleoside ABC transporter ATP-binding protein [Aminobacter aminovorans]SUU88252.1 Galactose/methyl galactoside import ATP-binding protein MglA [Aminobacter aminovorans]
MPPRLELRNITKSYPGIIANDDISMSIMPGEIHAVLGENGAGKSTLMKIIYGAAQADSGEIFCDGKPVAAHTPATSRALGIEMVYQHFALFESVTVVENIALAVSSTFDLDALARQITELSNRYGMPIDPHRRVHDLSVGERQRVEIVRCLLQAPKLLILDEPTSVLTPQAVVKLFETLRQLASEGCSIVYISHKLDEVQELCDTATVLRNGKVTGTARPKESTSAQLARMMVGAELPEMHVSPSVPSDKPVLEVRGLTAAARDKYGVELKNVSFAVRGGEIVGLAGVSGNGQAELISLLSGERTHGNALAIQIDGKAAAHLNASERRKLGMAFVPEERLGRGAVPPHALWQNAVLTAHRAGLVRNGLVDRKQASSFAAGIIERFKVKANGPQSSAQSLSGGNLQKFIVGREIALEPRLFLVAQPTWGVDVGAAAFIRQTIVDLSRSGAAVLVISEELDELFEICDRLLVICQGQVSPPLIRTKTNREEIGLLMTRVDRGNGTNGRAEVAIQD